MNIRGIGNKVQRGSALANLNTEYRYTMYEQRWLTIQGNAFIDIAAIRPAGDKLQTSFNPENFKPFGGIGIRVIHKYIHNAILRIDYGFSLGAPNKGGLSLELDSFFD
ncbi:MAG: hypothetical protein ABGW63_04350 [Flavobacteriaceae bacterium]